MAMRRMISKEICNAESFLEMPKTSQCLYFHLVLNSDDEGFVSPKGIMRLTGAETDDLKVLISKNFVIPFDSGVIVITHWNMMNCVQKDRFKNTIHIEEKASLQTDKNNAYYLSSTLETKCIHNGNAMDTQFRIGKSNIGEEKSVHPSENEWVEIQTAVYKSIDYDALISDNPVLKNEINGIVQIIVTAILSNEPSFIINGSPVPYSVAKETLLSLKYENVIEVIKTIKDKSIDDESFNVTNHYKYVLSALFNSAATYSLFEK
ncbi:MAG: hypothetical protein IKK53_00950 [Ruminiclostridium sp.]|nr:hypothetical protein [Ruminiclostridium sp.]